MKERIKRNRIQIGFIFVVLICSLYTIMDLIRRHATNQSLFDSLISGTLFVLLIVLLYQTIRLIIIIILKERNIKNLEEMNSYEKNYE